MIGLPYNTTALAKWCLGLTRINMLCDVVLAAMNGWLIWYVLQTDTGTLTGLKADSMGELYVAVSSLMLSVFVAVALAVLILNAIWIYRSSVNAAAIDPDSRRITPGWAVGWFAVPIANFWLPYVALRQTMNSSFGTGLNTPLPTKYLIWWGAWILSALTPGWGLRSDNLETSQQIMTTAKVDIAGSILAIVAGVFFIGIIRNVTDAQKDRANFKAEIFR